MGLSYVECFNFILSFVFRVGSLRRRWCSMMLLMMMILRGSIRLNQSKSFPCCWKCPALASSIYWSDLKWLLNGGFDIQSNWNRTIQVTVMFDCASPNLILDGYAQYEMSCSARVLLRLTIMIIIIYYYASGPTASFFSVYTTHCCWACISVSVDAFQHISISSWKRRARKRERNKTKQINRI